MYQYNVLDSFEDLKSANINNTQFIHMVPYWGIDINDNIINKTAFYTLDINKSIFNKTINKLNGIITFLRENNLTDKEKFMYVNYKLTDIEYQNRKVDSNLWNNIFGAFGNEAANCCGFAYAQNFLLNAAGVESYIVYTKSDLPNSNAVHFYNIAKLDNKYVASDSSLDKCMSSREKISYKCCGSSINELYEIQDDCGWKYKTRKIYDISGEEPEFDILSLCTGLNIVEKKEALANVLYIEGYTEEAIELYLSSIEFGEKEAKYNKEIIN